MNRLATLFNEYHQEFCSHGSQTDAKVDVMIPSFRLRIYGSQEELWADLWEEYPETRGWKVGGCVVGESPYNIMMVGLRQVGDKLNIQPLILGHEFVHLIKQVIADRDNHRDTGASIILNPDDLINL